MFTFLSIDRLAFFNLYCAIKLQKNYSRSKNSLIFNFFFKYISKNYKYMLIVQDQHGTDLILVLFMTEYYFKKPIK